MLPDAIFPQLLGIALILIAHISNQGFLKRWISTLSLSTAFISLLNLIIASYSDCGNQFDAGYQDFLSVSMRLLTAFIILMAIISAMRSPIGKKTSFHVLILILESTLIIFFSTRHLLLFYISFEFSLVPLFFLIGLYGGEQRIAAVYRMFLYTLFGSLIFLSSVLYIHGLNDITAIYFNTIDEVRDIILDNNLQHCKLLWIGLFLAFAVKMPMWPMHMWLPYAHVEAPTSASMILAGIVLKMAGYGIIRVIIQWMPELTFGFFSSYLYIIAGISVIYISFIAIVQNDIKRMIAYSSVAHMGCVIAGLVTNNIYAVEGAVMQMISHGIISAGLFMMIGFLYECLHTKKITDISGIAQKAPLFATGFLLLSLAAIGAPSTSSFIAEFMVILGLVKTANTFSITAGICIASGMVLSACYMLPLCKKVLFGSSNKLVDDNMYDLTFTMKFAVVIFLACTIYLGLRPQYLLDSIGDVFNIYYNQSYP